MQIKWETWYPYIDESSRYKKTKVRKTYIQSNGKYPKPKIGTINYKKKNPLK